MAAANKKLIVAVIGYTGGVGSCLLTAMKKIDLLPHALVRSSTMKIGPDASEEIPIDYAKLSAYLLQQDGIPVIADVTASAAVQENYEGWLKQGISVVAANKGIFAGSETKYQALLEAAKQGQCRLLHETTVGAGTSVTTITQTNPTPICFVHLSLVCSSASFLTKSAFLLFFCVYSCTTTISTAAVSSLHKCSQNRFRHLRVLQESCIPFDNILMHRCLLFST